MAMCGINVLEVKQTNVAALEAAISSLHHLTLPILVAGT